MSQQEVHPSWNDEVTEREFTYNKEFIKSTVEETGGIHPMLILVAYTNPETGETSDVPGRIVVASPPEFSDWGGNEKDKDGNSPRVEMNKDLFAMMGRMASVKFGAVAAFFMSEAWALQVSTDMSPAEQEAYIDKWRGRMHLNPDRKEIALFSAEVYTTVEVEGKKLRVGIEKYHWQAPITRDGDKASLGEWSGGTMDALQTRGRFCEFLAPPEAFAEA
jgi:hypothetical protein